jgi:hypothetical protein
MYKSNRGCILILIRVAVTTSALDCLSVQLVKKVNTLWYILLVSTAISRWNGCVETLIHGFESTVDASSSSSKGS